MKAIIVEDEIIAAQAMQRLIKEINDSIEILTVLQTVEESIEWFSSKPMPDIVFMDIHLADGSAFSIFEEVEITCPIVFTTAYDEYALKAFKVNSIDYLLKPIQKSEMERAILKYQNFVPDHSNKISFEELLATLRSTKKDYKTHFLIPFQDKLLPLPVKDIAYIYIDSKLVKAVTYDEKCFYFDKTLEEIAEELNEVEFFRANRQFIIAHKAIKDISLWFGSKLSVNLNVSTPEKIIVSKARTPEFKLWYTHKNS